MDAAIEALNAIQPRSGRVWQPPCRRRGHREELEKAEQARVEELEKRERETSQELSDIRDHWAQWRVEWEQKLATNEMQFLRSVADLKAAFQHRVTLMDANYRDAVRSQHDRLHRPPGPARAGDPEAPVGRPGARTRRIRQADPRRTTPHPPADRGGIPVARGA